MLEFVERPDDAARALFPTGTAVVVVPVYDAYVDSVRCIQALLRHTPAENPILIVDDAGPDRRFFAELPRLVEAARRHLVVLVNRENQGFVRSCNAAFEATRGRDVALVNSDVVVGSEWLERLAAAAHSSSVVATASTLSNHGTILSVPERNRQLSTLPAGLLPDDAALRVAAASLRTYPTIPTAVGHCTYIRRGALDLVGGFDEAYGRGYGEEVDFSQRCVARGLRHVCADDVFTFHRGGGSFGTGRDERQERNHALVIQRYPWYDRAVWRASHDRGPLADALTRASIALRGLQIGVDARCLGPDYTGTQHVVLRTVEALAAHPNITTLTVFTEATVPGYAAEAFSHHPEIVPMTALAADQVGSQVVDLVYRPYQVADREALKWLFRVGSKVVVNQLDVIAFHNPSYFLSAEAWLDYRALTEDTLLWCDGVAFISEHGREEARRAGLVPDTTPTRVVHCGTEAPIADPSEGVANVPEDRPLLLCLGQSFAHKNREFALRVFDGLRRDGWDGQLVLVGPTPTTGTSIAAEDAILGDCPELAERVSRLGGVSEAEKTWLFQHAALVIYPTVVEGFGLVPFEAAAHGVPTLSTRQGSLDEVLPHGIPVIDGFDVDAAVSVAAKVLGQRPQQELLVGAVLEQRHRFTWQGVAEQCMELFVEVLERPSFVPRDVRSPRPDRFTDEHVGGDATPRPPAWFERTVALTSASSLGRRLVAPGSSRQRVVRGSVNRVRRTLG